MKVGVQMAFEPNHTCKNPKCNESYYACDSCDQTKGIHWRSLCCSAECFKEYMRIIDERDNPTIVNKLEIQDEIKETTATEIKRTYKK